MTFEWLRWTSKYRPSDPTPATKYFPFAGTDLLFPDPVTLGAHAVDFSQHSFQKRVSRCRGDTRPLKLPDFTALPLNLGSHPLDFVPELVKLHGALVQPEPFQFDDAQRLPAGLPVREGAGDSTGG